MTIPFARVSTRQGYESLLAEIGQHIGITPNQKTVYPIPKDHRLSVFLVKFLTRLLGCWSPLINTTIAFAKTLTR